jgi:hypothetical protein
MMACSIGAEVESCARRKGYHKHPARSAKKVPNGPWGGGVCFPLTGRSTPVPKARSELWLCGKLRARKFEFLNEIQAITMCLTTESLEMSYHWATMTERQVSFYSRVHDCWPLNNKSTALFTEARRVIRNAFDWISSEIRKCIEPDLVVLETQMHYRS